eukprot:s514_g7.t1
MLSVAVQQAVASVLRIHLKTGRGQRCVPSLKHGSWIGLGAADARDHIQSNEGTRGAPPKAACETEGDSCHPGWGSRAFTEAIGHGRRPLEARVQVLDPIELPGRHFQLTSADAWTSQLKVAACGCSEQGLRRVVAHSSCRDAEKIVATCSQRLSAMGRIEAAAAAIAIYVSPPMRTGR